MTAYPPAPWLMHGSMWLSVFRLPVAADERHPAGIYGAALVDYVSPSPLEYGELLVARAGRRGRKRVVTITDIWVDSPASLAGGRELWAIPKELCDFEQERRSRGPLTQASWSAVAHGEPIVTAEFSDVSKLALRTPFKGYVEQPGIPEHPELAHVVMGGSAKALPCRAQWTFTPDGPLGFLGSARQLGSFRMTNFRLRFE
ncbi:acetoacetate decarboxylase family protein [Nocardioides limicola]|uniref:acetoacetate decarboxylase family protein n=1 Tax=Nocardioides limicola TaxID=2803368 RepID=UPI00193B9BD0|nr:acetoacetate decarboxylase family protein [Nocardioides sp. DJM-14]